jgi:ATP-dependent Lon protease
MEIIRLAGYTPEEKLHIAQKYLVPRQLEENGLQRKHLFFSKDCLRAIANKYTREAGVRELERQIGSVARGVATNVAKGRKRQVRMKPEKLKDYLGPPQFDYEMIRRTGVPGVATGLAFTPSGGDILFIEAQEMPGKGNLTLTGQIGEVMKESAMTAFSLVRSRAEQLNLKEKDFTGRDVHVHVPAGAIPKDGPSAGAGMVCAIVSLLTGRTCHHDVAMTGEITLTGRVLPVGGIKEKVLAAHRAGVKRVILPVENKKDLGDIPEDIRKKKMKFTFAEDIDKVLRTALVKSQKSSGTRKKRAKN